MRSNTGRVLAVLAMLMGLLCIGFWIGRGELPGSETLRTVLHRIFRREPRSSFVSDRDAARRRAGNRLTSATLAGAKLVPGPEAITSCTLTGTVVNDEKAPIKDARVTIRAAGGSLDLSFTTGDDGQFSFAQIPPGTYNIVCVHAQYVALIRPSFTLKAEEPVASLIFRMPLGATLKGKIVDEEGQPLAGVQIVGHRRKMEQVPGGGDVFLDDATYRTAQSSPTGEFSIAAVSIGENVFDCTKPGYQAESRVVNVRPEKVGEALQFTLKKNGRISGIVVNENGSTVSGAVVQLTRYKPLGRPSETLQKEKFTTTTEGSGKFLFSKLFNEGFYDISVQHESYAPAVLPLVPPGTEKLTCVLEQGGVIEGTTEFIDRESTPASVLLAAETVIKGTTFTREMQSDGAGRFRLEHLPYGTYKLLVQSTVLAGEPKTDVPCVKDKPTKDVVVEVYEKATARGRVLDAQDDAAIGGAKVTVTATYGVGRTRTRAFQADSDGQGVFEFDRLPSGMHVAHASARGYVQSVNTAAAQTFGLQPGERKTDVVLKLSHGGSVEGFVLDPNGRPVGECDVQLYCAGTLCRVIDTKALKAKTDGTGYFKIWGIAIGGRIQLYASAQRSGYAKTRSSLIDLTEAKPDVSTQIVLTQGAIVTGKITDSTNLPVPGAEVQFASGGFAGDPSPSDRKVHSRADGSYMITCCAAGAGVVTVSGSGFIQQQRSVSMRDGQRFDGVNFKLLRGVTLAGRVTTLEGNPVPNAKVRAAPVSNAALGRDETLTNKNGEYRLTNLGEGYFRVETEFKLPTPDGEQVYKFFLPKVKSGGNARVDIDCDVDNNASGLVVDESRKGINKFTVSWRSKTDPKTGQDFVFNLDRAYSTARGIFRVLQAPRGVYSLTIASEGYETYRSDNVYVGPGRRTVLPRIKLRSAGGLKGTVVSSTTERPVNNVLVRVTGVAKADSVTPNSVVTGVTDYLGNFRFSSVGEGDYTVEFEHPNYQAYRLDRVAVVEKRSTDMGQISLESCGTLKGTIVDHTGAPVPYALVTVSSMIPQKRTYTDVGGNFLLQGVRPGTWSLVVQGTVGSRRVYSFQSVSVQADETETADFVLETTADLDGALAVADGAVRSGTVRIHPFDETATALEDIHYDATVSSQNFSIPSVPPGQYFLWATGLGANTPYTVWQSLFLQRGPNSRTVVVPASLVAGRVLGPVGQAMASVSLQLLPRLDGHVKLPQSLYNSLMRAAYSGANGVFQFNYVQPGNYQLLYLSPTGAFAGQWMAMPPFSIGNSQSIPNMDVMLNE
jgi:protocatechuate 3,4-dioxygenase beta subunit